PDAQEDLLVGRRAVHDRRRLLPHDFPGARRARPGAARAARREGSRAHSVRRRDGRGPRADADRRRVSHGVSRAQTRGPLRFRLGRRTKPAMTDAAFAAWLADLVSSRVTVHDYAPEALPD